jgi:TRAP-type mannitol/chloroaromatic compound transport system permease small subunit
MMSAPYPALTRFAERIDSCNAWLGKIAAWAVLSTVLITFVVVILRYGFTALYSIALQESAMYFHAMIFMLGAAYTFKKEGHVRVDIFYQNFSDRHKALVNMIGTVLFLIPVCGFILWMSSSYVMDSWAILEGSREVGGLPLVFILKSLIPILSISLLLHACSSLIHSIHILHTPLQNGAEN